MSLAYLRYDPDNLTGFPAPEKYRAQILYFAKTLYTAPQDPYYGQIYPYGHWLGAVTSKE